MMETLLETVYNWLELICKGPSILLSYNYSGALGIVIYTMFISEGHSSYDQVSVIIIIIINK